MQIMCITGVSVITPQPADSRKLYRDDLGLPLEAAEPGAEYYFTEHVEGAKHFGVWPLAEAAEACFGSPTWPSQQPVPQASIEFEVASEAAVADAASELQAKGHTLLHGARKEPWGQTVARLQSVEGLVIGISYAPVLHPQTAVG